ncbi:hypothetical protein AHAS_Ahas01G0028800 [Arachis hypogaea]
MAAQQEAKHLGHKYIGTEHILLGLLLEETGMAAKVLDSSGVDLGAAREQTENLSGRGGGCSGLICTELRFTADAKSVLELSIKQARHKGHHQVDTIHLLLALLLGSDRMVTRLIENQGADVNKIRAQASHIASYAYHT